MNRVILFQSFVLTVHLLTCLSLLVTLPTVGRPLRGGWREPRNVGSGRHRGVKDQTVTKGLSSSSKFSGSCVPTLQTLPRFTRPFPAPFPRSLGGVPRVPLTPLPSVTSETSGRDECKEDRPTSGVKWPGRGWREGRVKGHVTGHHPRPSLTHSVHLSVLHLVSLILSPLGAPSLRPPGPAPPGEGDPRRWGERECNEPHGHKGTTEGKWERPWGKWSGPPRFLWLPVSPCSSVILRHRGCPALRALARYTARFLRTVRRGEEPDIILWLYLGL